MACTAVSNYIWLPPPHHCSNTPGEPSPKGPHTWCSPFQTDTISRYYRTHSLTSVKHLPNYPLLSNAYLILLVPSS
jgi:hypothetical protein